MRDKLINLLDEVHHKPLGKEYPERLGTIVDFLIAHGVIFAEDNNVPCKKPVLYNVERGALCPACDRELDYKITVKRLLRKDSFSLRHKTDFCKYCGQALDWGNEAPKEIEG